MKFTKKLRRKNLNQQTTFRIFTSSRIPVLISYSEILLSILKFITLDGRPLDIINDSGLEIFKSIVLDISRNSNQKPALTAMLENYCPVLQMLSVLG